jgi:hypothetical protein
MATRILATFLMLAAACALRAAFGHGAAYVFLALCIAVPRLIPLDPDDPLLLLED